MARFAVFQVVLQKTTLYLICYLNQHGTTLLGRHYVRPALKFIFKEKKNSADLTDLKGVRCFNLIF